MLINAAVNFESIFTQSVVNLILFSNEKIWERFFLLTAPWVKMDFILKDEARNYLKYIHLFQFFRIFLKNQWSAWFIIQLAVIVGLSKTVTPKSPNQFYISFENFSQWIIRLKIVAIKFISNPPHHSQDFPENSFHANHVICRITFFDKKNNFSWCARIKRL